MIHSSTTCKTLILSMAIFFALALSLTDGKLFAQEPARRPLLNAVHRCFHKKAQETKQTSAWGRSYGVPSPSQGPAPTQGPCTPWYGYGLGVPTYNYGWFGATYRPTRVSHTTYYGNYYQWSWQRGY